jgi:hypothetical protein
MSNTDGSVGNFAIVYAPDLVCSSEIRWDRGAAWADGDPDVVAAPGLPIIVWTNLCLILVAGGIVQVRPKDLSPRFEFIDHHLIREDNNICAGKAHGKHETEQAKGYAARGTRQHGAPPKLGRKLSVDSSRWGG